MRKAFLASTLLAISAAAQASTGGTCTSGVPDSPAAAGGFGTLNGQIYTPDGQVFVPNGIDVIEGNEPSVSTLLQDFPGINFVRLAIYDYASPATLQSYVDSLTSAGIVVELEDHTTSTGANAGGGNQDGNTIFTAAQQATENAWYSSVASAFATNPYVWFGTDNEPATNNPATGQDDPAGLSAWQQSNYNAVRNAGNNSPILIEDAGVGDMVPSYYANMTNAILDPHFYGWVAGYSTNPSTVASALNNEVSSVQQSLQAADGTMPVIIGEYGNSTSGLSIDPDGTQVVQVVQGAVQSGSVAGAVAWAWGTGNPGDGLSNSNGSTSAYGQQVAAGIAATATGPVCPVSTVVPSITSSTQATAANASASPSVAQVAVLAAQGGTATSTYSSVAAGAQQAASGPSAGGTLNPSSGTDPALTAIMAANQVSPVVLAQPAPAGISPTPSAAAGTTSIDASGNGQTIVAGAGDGSGTVSGNENVVQATGGIENISVTGTGNQITTGPYNDTITLSAGGNTIDGGGGNDAVVLAYGGGASVATNADLAAEAPLAGSGNTFIAPPPGTGTLTIEGTLAEGDTIDLTQALAGTTWTHTAQSMWQFVSAAWSPSGCTISIGGQVIVRLPGGSPGGNLGPFIVAH
jgi:Cellulase (glycosyl hydrolase family 5)